MLILGRKDGEKIHLGDNIVVKVVEISKNGVKLGIEAPKELIILRGELVERVEKSNKMANSTATTREIKDLSRLLSR